MRATPEASGVVAVPIESSRPGGGEDRHRFLPETVIQPLVERAAAAPGEEALTFLRDGEGEGARLTCGELDRRARRFASHLRSLAAPGERALLLAPPGLDYVAAFLGCLYAGIVAVPAYPPRNRRGLPRIRAIVRDSGATVAVAGERILDRTRSALEEGAGSGLPLRWVAAEAAGEEGDAGFEPAGLGPDTLAFLQYTSGSTGDPKGVMVSHGNLVHNQTAIAAGFGTSRDSRMVSWLPPFHDMGLIGAILNPLFVGYPCVLMTPAAFLQRPLRWLEAISRFRATLSGGPNFAYDLCVAKIAPEQVAELDLRSWRVAFNGAEPVRAQTLRRFAEHFAPAGFRGESFVPCYGLAEVTLLATVPEGERAPLVRTLSAEGLAAHRAETHRGAADGGAELVSCGAAAREVRTVVADPETGEALPDGAVGEIWLGGPSVAQGYWNRPRATEETFRARVRGGGGEPFLRTGDLGFLDGGELYVTGRLKELIILGGRNVYPQDVERVVDESHPALRRHSGAAFSVEEAGGERLVVVQELRPRTEADPEQVLGAIREAVGEACDAPVHAVALVGAGSVPKTTSGKIMRGGCRERYLAGDLPVVAQWRAAAPPSPPEARSDEMAGSPGDPPKGALSSEAAEIESWLSARLAEMVGTAAEEIDPRRPFAYYGVGSADAVGLLGETADRLGRKVDPEAVFEHPTVRALAAHLAGTGSAAANGSGARPALERGPVRRERPAGEEIAVVGIACRLPGADDPEALWELLCLGGDLLREAPEGHPARNGGGFRGGFLDPRSLSAAVRAAAGEDGTDDADPHHQRLLEVTRDLLARTGYRPEDLASRRIGVYVGMGASDHRPATPDPASGSEEGAVRAHLLATGLGSMAANRISHEFDWCGPSMTIDTACSSSLVALHTACGALRGGDAEMALVAGARLLLDPATASTYEAAGALSPSGRCRTFDDRADGFVCGEGVAAVLLEPLEKALEEGHDVWAVVRGTAVNHDGGYKVGLGAPNPRAQRDLLQRAYDGLRVDPESLGLLEVHGSATRTGDALELRALSRVLGARTPLRGFCALGSIKSNLGHTEAVSGLAGLIKAVLCLRHGQLPPTLHVETPNREIAFEDTPFFVNDRLRPWVGNAGVRRAGVSAFGVGGTNAHAVLEEAPRGRAGNGSGNGGGLRPARPVAEVSAAPAPAGDPASGSSSGPEPAAVEAWLRGRVAALVGGEVDEIGAETAFLELGVDSVGAMRLVAAVEEALGERVSTLEVYEHPHVRSFAGYLAERLRETGRDLPADPPPAAAAAAAAEGARDAVEPFPCTELQGAYLMARELPAQLGGRGCRIYIEVDLPGADGPALEEAFERLVRRHSMLRTVFPGDGTQRTLSEVPRYDLPLEDLSGRSPEEAEARCGALRRELSRTDLDPARWPLFDLHACRLDGGTVRLFLSLDMVQVDFLSFLILMEEWRRLHDHPGTELPALPVDFSRYVEALAELRGGERYREDREFWLERLEGFPQPPALPLRSDADALQRPDFASVGRSLSERTWSRLQELATEHGVTPSAVLGTAYCRALVAWSGSERFALNLPLFNRYPIAGCEEIDRLVGPFTTNVLLDVDLNGDGDAFWDQARSFHTTTLEALEHRRFTGVELTRALLEHRRGGLTPVAPVVFTPALYRGKEDLWGEIRLALSQTAMVWLDCIAVRDGGGLRLFWDFVESLFDRADVEARFERFVAELEGLAGVEAGEEEVVEAAAPDGDPARPRPAADDAERWAGWPFVSRDDWRRILEVNDTGAWYPRRPLHELFRLQAERTPDAPAVFDGERRLTYRELAERAHRVARALVRRGVEPGSRVAVMMRRGAEPVVAILGVLEAGAAYVPVDPAHPLERRLYTLRHCEPAVVLSRADVLDGMSGLDDLPVLDLDGPEVAGAPAEPVEVPVTPDSPAYLIYTSGSTGRPKGAVLTHGNAVNTVYDVGRRFGIGPGDRFFGFSSLGFDLSVFDLFGTLIHGAALVVVPEPSLREPAHWMKLLVRHGVTVWNSVPTAMKMLVDYWEGRGEEVPSLRLVMLSGDWVPVDLPDRIRGRFPNARVVALGGPTECTIWQNWYPIGEVDPEWTSIPYGRPLSNHRIYVLDDDLRPVPPGEVGQMVIAGDGVGLGYWNDPEKTDEAFFVHPVLGQRMYRSGDLGRHLPDMSLEILGRVDHQVKVRGYRIELGEIEAALRAHPAIDTAVVVAAKDRLGESLLVAFYTASSAVAEDELHRLLADRLPDYMVPSRIRELSEMPLNDNAKIDRKTLTQWAAEPAGAAAPIPAAGSPEPERTDGPPEPESPDGESAPPRPAAADPAEPGDPEDRARKVEETLLASWRELFRAEDLDPEDNFFELGGNSQLAVRAIRGAGDALGVEVQVADLFSYPTVRKLSAALAERMAPAGPTPEPPPEPPADTPTGREADVAAAPDRDRPATVDLASPPLDEALRTAYATRRSWRELDPAPVPSERLGRWLASLRQLTLDGEPKYPWASAGGLYPIQVYLQVAARRVEGLEGGTYYFDPEAGSLVRLGDDPPRPEAHRGQERPVAEGAAFALHLVAQLPAVRPIYGDRCRDLCFVEAGLMTQVLEAAAPEHRVGLCRAEVVDPGLLGRALDIGPDRPLLQTFLGGGLSESQAARAAADAEAVRQPPAGSSGASVAPPLRPAAPSCRPTEEMARNPYAGLPIPQGVELFDPDERQAFKEGQPGVRRELRERPAVAVGDALPAGDIAGRYGLRRSWRRFSAEPVPFEALGRFLSRLRRVEVGGGTGFLWISTAERAPVRTYLHVRADRVEGVTGGLYHYRPGEHRLVPVCADPSAVGPHMHYPHNREIFDSAAFSVHLVGDLAAFDGAGTGRGERRDLCLFEAGLMAQALEAEAAEGGIGFCQIGDLGFAPVAETLGLGEDQPYLHSMLCGMPHPDERRRAELDGERLSAPEAAARLRSAPAPSSSPSPVRAPGGRSAPVPVERDDGGDGHAIAVVAMAGRFPRAEDPDRFWELLRAGTDLVTEIPKERWDVDRTFDPDPDRPGTTYSRWGAFLDGIEDFDPLFFKVSPAEARVMDPQQRLLLELGWETLERAGYADGRLAGSSTGVFVGASYNHHQAAYGERPFDSYMSIGSHNALIANRLSYFFDFHGPSMMVDTLCSSSLVALHLACQSLRRGECGHALVGAAQAEIAPRYYEALSRLRALSPTGRCHTFDRAADGFVPGEGAGMVLLEPLERALERRDPVIGVIRGSAVNHGGHSGGLTVPSPIAQAALIRTALDDAGVAADTIGYLEAHGTGTSLGDPIEVDGLTRAFREDTDRSQFCAIGSLKSNLGHLEPAAGVGGLIKILLALRESEIPPTLHVEEPNPEIRFEGTPFYVVDRPRPWEPNGHPRRAGISGFGMGGANAHLVVEEPPIPDAPERGTERPVHQLVLSARSESALAELARRFAGHFAAGPQVELADAAYTANTGRALFPHRLAVTADDLATAAERLAAFARGEAAAGVVSGHAAGRARPRPVFLFAGQGAQKPGAGAELYRTQPVFRGALDRCAEVLDGALDRPLLDLLLRDDPETEELLRQTRHTQPALFALEYALAELWRSWGVEPAAVLGHSLGEYVAACVAGVFSLEDGLRLVAERGRLMQELPEGGAMAALGASEERVRPSLGQAGGAAVVAAVNGPESTVVSGDREAVEAVVRSLEADGVRATRLAVSHAFHSPRMEPILDRFEAAAARIEPAAPRLPLVSNVLGRPFGPGEVPDAAYWRRHVREAVRFGPGLEALAADGHELFLELGPAATLTGLGRRALGGAGRFLVSLAGGSGDWNALLRSLGTLFTLGSPVDWNSFDAPYGRRRVPLPTTPFERTRCWLDPVPPEPGGDRRPREEPPPVHPLLGRRLPSGPDGAAARFERCFAPGDEPLADQHTVHGVPVLPGAAQVEMMVAAAREVLGEVPVCVEDLAFVAPFTLPGGAPRIGGVELREEADGLSCRVVSRPRDEVERETGAGADREPVEHSRARVRARTGSEPARRDRPEEPPSATAPESFYRRAGEMGLDYGPVFRPIRELRTGGGRALARLEGLSAGSGYLLEPGLLDGAFQTLAALFALDGPDGGGLQLPFAIRRLVVHRPLLGPVRAVARWSAEGGTGRVLRGDVDLVGAGGEVLVEVAGLAVRPGSAVAGRAAGAAPSGWLMRRAWSPVAEPGPRRALDPGTWLLAADDAGVARALGERLERHGLRCAAVVPGPAYGRGPGGAWTLRPAESSDWQRLLDDLRGEVPPLRGIVHLWGAGAPEGIPGSPEELRERIERQVESLAALVRARAGTEGACELWLVTRGAEAFDAAAGPAAAPVPERAAALGLMRAARLEVPALDCRSLDLPATGVGPEGLAQAIEETMLLATPPPEAAWRSGALWRPELEPAEEETAAEEIPDGAVVWITGGLGDLGLELARALVRGRPGTGAPRLVLQSRTPLPPREEWPALLGGADADLARRLRTIRELEAAGAEIWPVAVDAADPRAMDRLARDVEERWGKPFAIVHAAGLVRDGFLRSKAPETFRQVLRPKVEGGWVLDRIARERGIGRLVLFSSVVAVAGNPGQGDYAAANAYLDALALAGAAEGRRTVSLGWGPWSEVGMAARAGIDPRALGVEPIPPAVGRELALRALRGPAGHRVVLRRTEPGSSREPRAAGNRKPPAARDPKPRTADGGRDLGRRLEDWLAAALAAVLGMEPDQVERETNFMELGFDSLMAVRLQRTLSDASGLRLDPTLLFEHASVRELAAHLASEHSEELERMLGESDATGAGPGMEAGGAAPAAATPPPAAGPEPLDGRRRERERAEPGGREIAVVGLACRFPGAETPEAFWELIRRGTDAIREVPGERWDWRDSFDPTGERPGTTRSRWGGFLDRIDRFDPAFFGLSPREAKLMDPQQRLFLEVVWEALERAGYRPDQLARGRTGVFAGIAASDYGRVAREHGAGLDPHMGTGSVLSMVPNRVSYLFDWKGPSMAVDTACSSSLVALDLACRCLRDGEAEMAVVGGSNLILTPDATVVFSQAGMLSGRGRCMTFDDRADGYVRGEGVAAVLLKPLDRALADGDDVQAVVRGVVVNHDGHSKASLTAPNPKAQRDLLLTVYERAGVSPETVGLLEAHGTGTSMGDPIEVRGLTEAFRRHTDRHGFCALGSVKSNVGHLEPAAGMAGLIKAILALRHRELLPTLHVESPNRKIAFEETPFYVCDQLRPWPEGPTPRRAGVSSFGFGGVNAHAVLEEAPAAAAPPAEAAGADRRPVHLFKLSARSPETLGRLAGACADHLRRHRNREREGTLADLCFTANTGRCDFEHRVAFLVESREQLRDELERLAAGERPAVSGDGSLEAALRSASAEAAAALRAWCSGDLWLDSLERELRAAEAGGSMEGADLPPERWREAAAALAGLYARGVAVDWEAVEAGFRRRRVPLPTYPFERRVCWCGDRAPAQEAAAGAGVDVRPSGESLLPPVPAEPDGGPAHHSGTGAETGEEMAARPPAAATDLASYLRERVGAALELDAGEVPPDADLMSLGLESVSMMEVVAAVERDFGLTLYPAEILRRPTIRELASYLEAELASGVAAAVAAEPPAARGGSAVDRPSGLGGTPPARESVTAEAPAAATPPPVFVLSSPRSGSTLLRVMLAGHPELFCPPELHLLGHRTLGEREAALGGSYLGEGLQRALMELEGLDADATARRIAELTRCDLPVAEVYRMLRERAAGRALVDKSPSYASDLGTLARAEEMFDGARFIALARRPEAVMESFARRRMHRLLGLDGDPFDVAEEIWRRSYRNLLELRSRVGSERLHLVRYEDLVRDPESVLREVCAFLGLVFDPAVLTPYEGERMTDGVRPESMAIGDPGFHRRRGIDPSLADAWKRADLPRPLAEETRRLVAELGYPAAARGEEAPKPAGGSGEVLVPLRAGGRRPPLFCFHPAGGQVFAYSALVGRLDPDQPVWALQSRALDDPSTERPTLAAMAADYAARIREVQPRGEPFRLLGWSMGGHLALASAAELEAAGEEVAFVGLWDSRAAGPEEHARDGGALRAIASAFGGVIGAAFDRLEPEVREALVRELTELGPEQRIRRAVGWARERGVLRRQVPVEALVTQVALVEAHVDRIRRHEHRTVRAPIHVWWARDDLSRRPTTDWSRWSEAAVRTSVVDGNHFTMVHGAGLERLATELDQDLERLEAGGAGRAGRVA